MDENGQNKQVDMNDWRARFDERQLKEIDFSTLYADQFHHGTDGHNAKMIVAQMAHLLEFYTQGVGARIFADAAYDAGLEYAAKWIEGSAFGDQVQFATNMAMSIRAAKRSQTIPASSSEVS